MKITDLDIHVIVEEDVAELQVSVDDSVGVQVLDTFEQLGHVVASLWLSHSLTPLVQLQQGLKTVKKMVGCGLADNENNTTPRWVALPKLSLSIKKKKEPKSKYFSRHTVT